MGGQTSGGRYHGSLDVLRTPFLAQPSWIQGGGAGNDVIQAVGCVFRSLLRRKRKMAALPLPVAILDDPKMATGSGRAAIFFRLLNRARKTRPMLLLCALKLWPIEIMLWSLMTLAKQQCGVFGKNVLNMILPVSRLAGAMVIHTVLFFKFG